LLFLEVAASVTGIAIVPDSHFSIEPIYCFALAYSLSVSFFLHIKLGMIRINFLCGAIWVIRFPDS
jgi:hypothetical protein